MAVFFISHPIALPTLPATRLFCASFRPVYTYSHYLSSFHHSWFSQPAVLHNLSRTTFHPHRSSTSISPLRMQSTGDATASTTPTVVPVSINSFQSSKFTIGKTRRRYLDQLITQENVAPQDHIVDIVPLQEADLKKWIEARSPKVKAWLKAVKFNPAKEGAMYLLPDLENDNFERIGTVIFSFGKGDPFAWWSFASLPSILPPGNYKIFSAYSTYQNTKTLVSPFQILFAWSLGCYKFNFYKSKKQTDSQDSNEDGSDGSPTPPPSTPKLVLPSEGSDIDSHYLANALATISSTYLVRDLINIPAQEMSPGQLQRETEALAKDYAATVNVILDQELLQNNYPQIHAVGRAAGVEQDRRPRLIELIWSPKNNNKNDDNKNMDSSSSSSSSGSSSSSSSSSSDDEEPQMQTGEKRKQKNKCLNVTIVGKGVCFDTGGLNIKPASSMRNMKKDMGGASQSLGLALMIMENNLNINLRVLIPAVENNISGNAFRPGDVLQARNGMTIEIDNTDAEGRLILADALVDASENGADIIIDMATLTGAQRIAMGPNIPSIFTNRRDAAEMIQKISEKECDHVWELPLYGPYRSLLDSTIADMKNCGPSLGGAITAALFLEKFVAKTSEWIHVDFMGYNASSKPGRPEGGEAQGMRALYQYLCKRC